MREAIRVSNRIPEERMREAIRVSNRIPEERMREAIRVSKGPPLCRCGSVSGGGGGLSA